MIIESSPSFTVAPYDHPVKNLWENPSYIISQLQLSQQNHYVPRQNIQQNIKMIISIKITGNRKRHLIFHYPKKKLQLQEFQCQQLNKCVMLIYGKAGLLTSWNDTSHTLSMFQLTLAIICCMSKCTFVRGDATMITKDFKTLSSP